MSEFRAKDADRERVVDVIEAAFADGRLGVADRDLRLTRARAAETLEELHGLTRDLPVPDARVAPAPTRAATRAPVRSGRVLLTAVIALVALVGLGVASTLLAAFPGPVAESPEEGGGPAQSSSAAGSDGAPFNLTPRGVRRFLRLYEAQFGTLDSYSVVFSPSRVITQVPVRGKNPRYQRWLFDGTWQPRSQVGVVMSPAQVVDLGQVGVDRLFANTTTAERVLRVDGARVSHVVVHHWQGEPASVNIYVANTFHENAFLRTTLAGDRITRRFPFEP